LSNRLAGQWGPYDGAVYAVIVARLFEPILRVPAAGLEYLTADVLTVIAGTVLFNTLTISRLRRRKRRGIWPLYSKTWYLVQFVYGLAVVAILAAVLPEDLFAGAHSGSIGWIVSLVELFSMQLFLGCALMGLYLGTAALPLTVPCVVLWITLCKWANAGTTDWLLAGAWLLWATVNTAAGALGGKVLTRMMDVGHNEEERSADQYRASILPQEFQGRTVLAQQQLASEVTQLMDSRLPALDVAVQRVAVRDPSILDAWSELIEPVGVAGFAELSSRFSERLRSAGVDTHITATGLDVDPMLSPLEEACLGAFFHVIAANTEPARARVKSLHVLIDADRLWLRMRATVRGEFTYRPPTDGLIHSMRMLHLLITLQRGSFDVVSVPNFGELVESRIPRSLLSH
jgi:hypothetical protein